MLSIFRKRFTWGALFCFIAVTICDVSVFAETPTVGLISCFAILEPAIEGFKKGMVQYGYIEGENIRYLYSEATDGSLENVDAEVLKMLSEGVDILFTPGNVLTDHVMKFVEGKNIPILFAAAALPVESGIVKSIGRPGGNVTGTRVPSTAPKALEWFLKISPNAKKAFLPYNPEDATSKTVLEEFKDRVTGIGIEVVYREIHSVEEAHDAIENLPEDIDAVIRIPSPTLDPRNSELSEAAIKRGIPMVSSLPLDDAVLLSFYGDIFQAGEKSARLAHEILHGAKPSELPVETSECSLTLNLETANKIGLDIPYEILMQVDEIIH